MPRFAGDRPQWLVAGLAMAVSLAGLANDFVYDDVAIIRDNVRIHDLARWSEILSSPYWPPPYVEQLYRPVAVLLLAIQYAAGGGAPFVFRLLSCALYVACSLGVYRFARRLVSPTAAAAIAALFAAHPVHVEAIALGVNQGELIVTLIAVHMAGFYHDRRRLGGLTPGAWAYLVALYALAVLTKENAFAIPGLLLAVEVFLIPHRPGEGASRLAAGYASLALVAVAAIALRAHVLPDAVAVVANGDLRGLTLGGRLLAMLQVVPTWLRLLAFPATLHVDYHLTPAASLALALQLFGTLLVLATLGLIIRCRRASPVLAFGLAWCVVALLPVSNIVPTGVLVAERTLLLPSVGFLLAVGAAAVEWLRASPSPVLRRRLLVACALFTALGLIKSVVRELSWNSSHVRITPRAP